MAPWIRSSRTGSSNGRAAPRPVVPVLVAGLGLMLAVPSAGAPRTTDTLIFSGLGTEPVSRTTETLRFTGRARGDTP